jgi:hypothetical protein
VAEGDTDCGAADPAVAHCRMAVRPDPRQRWVWQGHARGDALKETPGRPKFP